MFANPGDMNYAARFATFKGFWDGNEATARQLAAAGHVCDRPPVEAIENGSHCISCGVFVGKDDSVAALEGSFMQGSTDGTPRAPNLHRPDCERLQVRIPLDLQTALPGSMSSYRMGEMRKIWERRSRPVPINLSQKQPQRQGSSFFSLPTELRLQIYSMILPRLDKVTSIVALNGDSARIVTLAGYYKARPRDMTKNNILCTCNAIYEEARDILYTNRTFKFDSTKLLYLFLRHIGHHGRRLLSSVDVACGQREDAVAFALLASSPRLKTITIRLNRTVLMRSPAPLWLLDGVASLLELRALEDVHFGETPGLPYHLDERSVDAAVLKRELTRPRGDASNIRYVQYRSNSALQKSTSHSGRQPSGRTSKTTDSTRCIWTLINTRWMGGYPDL